MVVADAQGRIIAVNTVDLDAKVLPGAQTLLGRDVSNDAWFKQALAGKINPGESFVEDLHHDPLMAVIYGTQGKADLAMNFTAPIRDAQGQIVGVWTNRFNWDVATTVLADVEGRAKASGMSTAALGIASAEGTVLASPTRPMCSLHRSLNARASNAPGRKQRATPLARR